MGDDGKSPAAKDMAVIVDSVKDAAKLVSDTETGIGKMLGDFTAAAATRVKELVETNDEPPKSDGKTFQQALTDSLTKTVAGSKDD